MKKYCLVILVLMTFLSVASAACTGDTSLNKTVKNTSVFHLEKFNVEVELPAGWVDVSGPEALIPKGEEGLVAFNSWGTSDFWAKAERQESPDGPISFHYSSTIVASRIPAGGAYVALVEIHGPPYIGEKPVEYKSNDLSGLYQPHDWRQDSANTAYFKVFYKGDQDLTLVVACSKDASDRTVEQINSLLKSWKFSKTTSAAN